MQPVLPNPPMLPDQVTIYGKRYQAKFANWHILHQSVLNHVILWQVTASFCPLQAACANHRQQTAFNLPLVIKTLLPTASTLSQTQLSHEIGMLQTCQQFAICVLAENKPEASHKLATKQAGVAQLLFYDITPNATCGGFLAMPCYAAPNLRQLIGEQSLNFAQSLNIAHQLCRTLNALHDLNLLHGDVKPSNILYAPDHQQLIVLDFALAQNLPLAHGQTLPAPTTTAGTPAYMAPEQFMGATPSRAQENYSVGVILFELFTNTRLFTAATIRDWAYTHQNSPLPDIKARIDTRFANDTTFNAQQADLLGEFVGGLLAKYPDNRQNLLSIAQIFG